MKKYLLVVLLFVTVSQIIAQEEQVTIKTLYSLNNAFLTPEEKLGIREALYGAVAGGFTINVTGYTDNTGTQEYNQKLSTLRAKHVVEYIKSLVIDIKDISYEGKGEIDPVDGEGEAENPENRRVEVLATGTALKGKERKQLLAKISEAEDNYEESPELMAEYKELLGRSQVKVGSISIEEGGEEVLEARIIELDQIDQAQAGDAIIFPNINFKPSKDKILPTSKSNLDVLYNLMKSNPNMKIEIQGHVCCGESVSARDQEFISTLSDLRARSVYQDLVDRGIEAERMTYKGYGFTQPLIFPELTPEDEKRNRRVQIKILQN